MRIFKKFKRETLIDNYDKICHLLKLRFHPDIQEFSGICSLCGCGNFIHNQRCMNCRAKIEEDLDA